MVFCKKICSDGKWKLSEETPPLIIIKDDDGRINNIEFNQPLDATKSVGMCQDLTGSSSTKQMSELIKKVKHIHFEITKTPLPRHLNWIGLRQTIWKSIEYILTATTLSRHGFVYLAKEL